MRNQKIKIGIPKGLFYYRHFPFWKNFLEELGAEIIVSQSTDRKMLKEGISRLTDEICLSVKAFCGQVVSLKGKCDFILIPSIFSLEKKVHHCPKFIGLPDLIRVVVPELKDNILDPDINFDKGKKNFYSSLQKLGFVFTSDLSKIKRAISKAIKAQKDFENQKKPEKKGKINIALVAHPYLIYEEFLNHQIVSHLQGLGVNVLLPETMTKKEMRESLYKISDSPYWACEDEIMGAGAHFLERKDVEGLILITAFGCGPDSTMFSLLKIYAQRFGKLVLEITLDEHTAKTGLITRIEAFVDTIIENRKRKFFPSYPKKDLPDSQRKIKTLGIVSFGGKLKIFRKLLKENFGFSLICEPVTSKTLELGVRYSPEFICLPFKIMLGNAIQSLEAGADTLLMVTSYGPCRIGYYRKLLKKTLANLDYKFEMLEPRSEDKSPLGILKTIKRFTNNAPWFKIIYAFLLGIAKLRVVDRFEREIQKIRAVEVEKGTANQIFEEVIEAIDQAQGFRELNKTKKRYLEKLSGVAKRNIRPLKIGLIGEIFVLTEPFANLEIEKELGKMGVETERVRSTYFSEYTNFLHFDVLNEEKKALEKFTREYLKRDIGGHGLESIGKKIEWSKKFDGLIHLMPFGCLPEVMAQNIMQKTKQKIPVLTVSCDENLGKAGLITRLEAFVDLLWNRRKVASS